MKRQLRELSNTFVKKSNNDPNRNAKKIPNKCKDDFWQNLHVSNNVTFVLSEVLIYIVK